MADMTPYMDPQVSTWLLRNSATEAGLAQLGEACLYLCNSRRKKKGPRFFLKGVR